jgi:hypothetical protein
MAGAAGSSTIRVSPDPSNYVISGRARKPWNDRLFHLIHLANPSECMGHRQFAGNREHTGDDMATKKAKTKTKTIRKKATAKSGAKSATKQTRLIEMLRRPEGATIGDLAQALGWQKHSVRGAIAGGLKKNLGLEVSSEKATEGRVYRIVDGVRKRVPA